MNRFSPPQYQNKHHRDDVVKIILANVGRIGEFPTEQDWAEHLVNELLGEQ